MRLLHAWALEQPLLRALAVELSTFPELADRFQVKAAPHFTVRTAHGEQVFSGATPEPVLLARIVAVDAAD